MKMKIIKVTCVIIWIAIIAQCFVNKNIKAGILVIIIPIIIVIIMNRIKDKL